MRFTRVRVAIALSVAIVAAAAAWYFLGRDRPANQSEVHQARISHPMRDGVTLFTQVYIPRDTSKTYPILIQRTPFSVQPYGENRYRPQLGPGAEFDRAGYIFVFQDVRGRFQSGGNFVDMRPHIDQPAPGQTDESTDMYDTVEWLLKNVPSNNGRVGIWGMSYPGFYTSASIIDSHPAIKAASPEAPMTNLFLGDDAYHNGAFMLAQQFQIYANYFKPRSDGPEFPSPKIGSFFDYRTSDGYQFFLTHGPNVDKVASLASNPLLDENIQARQLRRLLESAGHFRAPPQRALPRADRGRMVRCRGPRGHVPHLSRNRGEESRLQGHDGHGTMGTRRLVTLTRRKTWPTGIRLPDRRVLPGQGALSVL